MSYNNDKSNVKEVFFNPEMKFENLSYNIEKNNNSIVQEMDIDLDGFETELNMTGGSNKEAVNQLSVENMGKINTKFNTINSLDPTLNQLGSGNMKDNEVNMEENQVNMEENQVNMEENQVNMEENEVNMEENEVNMEENEVNMEDNEVNMEDNEVNMEEMFPNNETKYLFGGSKNVENILSDDIDLNISSYKEIIHPLVNINNVKKCVNRWITNLKSNKMIKYKNDINKIYQKNIKIYKIIRENNKLILIDKKSNSQTESINIPDFKIIFIEKKKLEDTIIKLNQKLIHLYLDIKNNPNLRDKYSEIYKTTLNKYSSSLELLTSYNIYENIINAQNKDNKNNNNVDYEETQNNKTTIFLSDLKTDIYDQSNIYIENNQYVIDTNIIEITQQINKEQTNLYNDIIISINKDNDIKNDRRETRDLIKEYLDNSKIKTIKNKLNILKKYQNNKITYVIDKFN